MSRLQKLSQVLSLVRHFLANQHFVRPLCLGVAFCASRLLGKGGGRGDGHGERRWQSLLPEPTNPAMVGVGVAWGRAVLDWGPAASVTGASTGAEALGAMAIVAEELSKARVLITGTRSLNPVRYLRNGCLFMHCHVGEEGDRSRKGEGERKG